MLEREIEKYFKGHVVIGVNEILEVSSYPELVKLVTRWQISKDRLETEISPFTKPPDQVIIIAQTATSSLDQQDYG